MSGELLNTWGADMMEVRFWRLKAGDPACALGVDLDVVRAKGYQTSCHGCNWVSLCCEVSSRVL